MRLINLTKKNDVIASVCKVMSSELEAMVEAESRQKFSENNEHFAQSTTAADAQDAPAEVGESQEPEVEGDDQNGNTDE